MNKSLQEIEDYYLRQGLRSKALRTALEIDVEYQHLLRERKSAIRDKHGVTKEEEKEYLLPNEEDYEILSIVKILEEKELSDCDREVISLIKGQLKDDWR